MVDNIEKLIINKDNKVLKSEEYQKDKYMFSIIEENLNLETMFLISDEENYVAGRSEEKRPVWIWTKNDITSEKMDEIKEIIKYFISVGNKKFTVKKNVYDYFKSTGFDLINYDDYFEMGALECHELKKAKKCDGYLDKPREDEIDILAKYWHDDCREMVKADEVTMEEAYVHMKELIGTDTFLVWRNDDGKIVSMVKYKISNGLAKLNHVYTPDEERRKGYAANLIYEVTKLVVEKGAMPLLYTDYNYLPSNKSYMNVGYVHTGILINFSCK